MRLLVLGGTVFLGRHVTQAALARGHRVSLFNRGRRSAGLFAQAEHLVGDRDGDLSVLRGRAFDAVIDCSGYSAAQVQRAAQVLGDGAGNYVFVSSISVCASFPPGRRFGEDVRLLEGDADYGANKARAEEAIAAALPGRVAIVRPGLIVGPHDPTGRFSYWPARIARGGEVLAPGRPERPVQWIDVRDLAAWCLDLAEQRHGGTFNAIGPNLAMHALLDACRRASGSDARFTWIDDATLLAADVAPWSGLPLWIPDSDAQFGGMLLADNTRAVAAGLRCRGAEETARDTLAWLQGDPAAPRAPPDALTATRESELLHAAAQTGR
jgi:2'-hydroxyisoflavone reductase